MNQPKQERFKTSVGGQALMEGIMMRGPKQMCCAVRKPDGTIETKLDPTPTHGVWTKIPLVRGAISMIESMIVGYRYMMYSAQVSMGDDYDPAEEETAFEKWVGEHLGEKAENALLTVAAVLGGLLAILLFTVLPTFLVGGVNRLLPLGRWGKVVLEAVLKVAIFLTYMVGISKMKEIHRVFEYHGAEHKTIACYEAGDPLTVENVRKYTRFHPRCGTSFLILVVIVSVFLYSVLPWGSIGLRVVCKLLLLPLVMGISYELLKWCGRSDNIATRIIRQPGIWVQHLTVFEPDDSMIEVAIASVEAVFDWKEYQSRLQAVKKSTKRKKVAEEMRKSGMTAPLPIVDPANAKKKSGTELASEIKKREQEYKKRADERKKYMEEMQKREDEIAKVMDEVSKRKEERQALAQAQEEMTEDELSSLDRFFDDPDGTKSDMESKPSVDEVENG